jgi:hypothetical protein
MRFLAREDALEMEAVAQGYTGRDPGRRGAIKVDLLAGDELEEVAPEAITAHRGNLEAPLLCAQVGRVQDRAARKRDRADKSALATRHSVVFAREVRSSAPLVQTPVP